MMKGRTMHKHMDDGAMSLADMERHPLVRVASSGSWLDSAR